MEQSNLKVEKLESFNPEITSQFTERYAHVAISQLNQWSLSFKCNKERIVQSIKIAKQRRCTIRLGSELDITGYGCEDHFLEIDTSMHSWQILAEIIEEGHTTDILCSFGMPVIHNDVLYNCNIVVVNSKVVLIRPKMAMANDGNYREGRWFTPWEKNQIEDYYLPKCIVKATGEAKAPFGNAIIQCNDTTIGIESCEEIWQPLSTNISLGLAGVEIFLNNSGSHHELRKLTTRIKLIAEATHKNGGVYLYANQRGMDGNRLYFDGASMIISNGNLVKIGQQFSLDDVEVVSEIVNLNDVSTQRIGCKSRAQQTQKNQLIPVVKVDFKVCRIGIMKNEIKNINIETVIPDPMKEIACSPACYLWDYLRRSRATGYFLPLSGGADSSAVSIIIYQMCVMLYDFCIVQKKQEILDDLRKVVRDPQFTPKSAQEIVGKLFFTAYMGSKNSSETTRKIAANLAKEIGSKHFEIKIQDVCDMYIKSAEDTFNEQLKFSVNGGDWQEDLALQNIQARSRMVFSYFYSQLIPSKFLKRDVKNNPGFVLVLSAGNLDEGLRGYATKYDCSSGDINPIGSFSKVDLKNFLFWSVKNLNLKSVNDIINAVPSAELTPLGDEGKYVQSDEADMGMTYAELSEFGRLRKINRCGPFSMFTQLLAKWSKQPPEEIARKVKFFFVKYAVNRHKMTVMTPAIHGESYSIDDNRFDLRQFCYNTDWTYQFEQIDKLLTELKSSNL